MHSRAANKSNLERPLLAQILTKQISETCTIVSSIQLWHTILMYDLEFRIFSMLSHIWKHWSEVFDLQLSLLNRI